MAKRTQTSKGMRIKLRSVNRTNESLGADVKIMTAALMKAEKMIDELTTEVHNLTCQLEDSSASEQTIEEKDSDPEPEA